MVPKFPCPVHPDVETEVEEVENPKGKFHKIVRCPVCGVIERE